MIPQTNQKLPPPVQSGINLRSGQPNQIITFVQVTVPHTSILIKETIESYFYAYRLTGNKTYQERAWTAFQHISAVTRAPHGYSAIRDATSPGGSSQSDNQESFWLSETLKYLYLIFDDPARVSLDDWVFNTEAHPLKRGRKVQWY
jgi:mannosyl-oligosaccharide alpha-1,2-mannosidase